MNIFVLQNVEERSLRALCVAMDSVVSHEYTLKFLREDLLN